MDEDHAEPVVDVEIDVGVVLNEGAQLCSTARHRLHMNTACAWFPAVCFRSSVTVSP